MASIFDTLLDEGLLVEAKEFARLNPVQQAGVEARLFQRGTEQGVESLLRGTFGLPASQQVNRVQAGRELQELGRQVVPGTADFYKQAADILRKYGLVGEAETMMQRLQEVELGKGESQDVLKMQQALDLLLKRKAAGDNSVDPAIAALKQGLARYKLPAPHTPAVGAESIQIIERLKTETDPAVQKRLEARLATLNKPESGERIAIARAMLGIAGAGLAVRQAAETRAQAKDDAKEKAIDAQIASSIQGAIRLGDVEFRSAEALFAHPGLPYVTGRFVGRGGGIVGSFASDAAAGARALMDTVRAQTFLRALADLRALSKTGASGLGQLTEIEGDKIQVAKAALAPAQSTDEFKTRLGEYINQLKSSREVMVGELQSVGKAAPAMPAPFDVRGVGVSDLAPSAARPRRSVPPPAPQPAPKKRTFKATKVD